MQDQLDWLDRLEKEFEGLAELGQRAMTLLLEYSAENDRLRAEVVRLLSVVRKYELEYGEGE